MTQPRKRPAVPDAVRRAVERTFQSTLGPAGLTKERAQELADDVLRRAEESATRARRGVREADHRRREAAAGVGDRLRDAIAELKKIGGDEVSELRSEVESLRRRVDELERELSARRRSPRKTPATPASRAGTRKQATRSKAGQKGQSRKA